MSGLQLKYFVLKPRGNDAYARASREAIQAYIGAIWDTDLALAQDLLCWLQSCDAEAIREAGYGLPSEFIPKPDQWEDLT